VSFATGVPGRLRRPQRWPDMEAQSEHPAEEIRRLRRCINDLVSVIALPAMWSGSERPRIVRTLLDVLVEMLHLDLVYVRLKEPTGEAPIEMARLAQPQSLKAGPRQIGELLHRCLGEDPQNWPSSLRNRIGDEDISIVPLRLGLQGEIGFIVAGSQRLDFPGQTERLLLSVAANQATIGLQEARLLSEQKRIAKELDQRVAQRTSELAAANEELKKEVAERRRAEEAVRESERSARLIVDSIPGLIAILTPAGDVETANKQLLEYCGRTLQELKQWGATDTVHPDDRTRVLESFTHLSTSGDPYNFETRIRRFDGVYRWFQVSGLPLRHPDGRIARWCALHTDIDERKHAEQALQRSEAFLAEGQHLARMGNFSWRVATDEIAWSEQLYRIFEFDQGTAVTLELIGSRVHPEDIPMLNDMIKRGRGGVSDFEYEHRLLMPNGSVKHLHLVAHGSRNADGQLEFIGAVQDVTQRKLAEEALGKVRSELTHAARVASLGELTASIAHEVNQPLGSIINNANACLSLLAHGTPQLDEIREALTEIIQGTDQASAVISRVRQLVRKAPSERTVLNLRDVVADVLVLARHEFAARQVTILTELAEDLPPVAGDRVQLEQVLLNLVVNGMEAMNATEASKRALVIRGRPEIRDKERVVLLSVQDAGIGFKQDEMDRLFEAFYTTKPQGMGMGLAISRSIIEAHGGRLWAETNQGPGATFLFSLPAAPEPLGEGGPDAGKTNS
jgi:PAS domain S-box-containing protein